MLKAEARRSDLPAFRIWGELGQHNGAGAISRLGTAAVMRISIATTLVALHIGASRFKRPEV